MNLPGPWGNYDDLGINKIQDLTQQVSDSIPSMNALEPSGRIWVGANPENSKKTISILINKLGIKTFLCLQDESIFRNLNYRQVAQDISREEKKPEPCFINFPISDFDIVDDNALLNFLIDFIPKIEKGEMLPLFIHCTAGCGRTGTVASLILSYLYGLDGEQAMNCVQQFNYLRQFFYGSSPETSEQIQQVKRLAPILKERLNQTIIRIDREDEEQYQQVTCWNICSII